MRFLLLILLLVLGYPEGLQASSPPLPASKAEALSGLHDRLEQEKQARKRLEAELVDAEKKLNQTKKAMVKAGASVRANEELLLSLKERMAKLKREQDLLTEEIDKDRAAMGELILALQRIRRVPTEALIVRPGAPLKTAQSALLLNNILPVIHHHAEDLSRKLQDISDLQTSLEKDRTKALKTQALLEAKYKEVAELSVEREKLYKSVNIGLKQSTDVIDRISREAKNLAELLAALETEKKRQAAAKQAKRGILSTASLPATGAPRLPVLGVIQTRYGDKDNIGAARQGITIGGINSALVVAPMGGVVRFAGEFKNYGRLIILEHEDDYHSLIGGLEAINIAVGEKVGAGEPVGKLPVSTSRDEQPTLYYELRYKGSPIDPSKKFSGLKS